MKKLFLLAVLLIPCRSWAASCSNTNISNGWICVISTSKALGANGGSTTGVNTSTSTSLYFIINEYAGQGAPTTQCTPTDTIGGNASGNTWTKVISRTDGGVLNRTTIWKVAGVPAVGASHVVTCSSTGIFATAAFVGYQSLGGASLDGGSSAETSMAATTIQPGSITPKRGNELLITAVGNSTNGISASSINQSFTIVENIADVSGANEGLAFAHLTQSTPAAVNPTWTMSGSSASPMVSVMSSSPINGGKGQFMLIGVGK